MRSKFTTANLNISEFIQRGRMTQRDLYLVCARYRALHARTRQRQSALIISVCITHSRSIEGNRYRRRSTISIHREDLDFQ